MAKILQWIAQPNNTTQGYTLVGSAQGQVNLGQNAGLQIGLYDNSTTPPTLQTADTTPVVIAIQTNPNSGTLSGTLTQIPVRGIASFPDLAITNGGNGYVLQATASGYTAANSNAFNLYSLARINQDWIVGTITTTGIGTAAATVGPYRFRSGVSLRGLEISAVGVAPGDTLSVYVTEPGAATATTLTAALAQKPTILTGGSEHPIGPLTVPFHVSMDSDQLGGECDVYVIGTTVASTNTVAIKRVEFGGRC